MNSPAMSPSRDVAGKPLPKTLLRSKIPAYEATLVQSVQSNQVTNYTGPNLPLMFPTQASRPAKALGFFVPAQLGGLRLLPPKLSGYFLHIAGFVHQFGIV